MMLILQCPQLVLLLLMMLSRREHFLKEIRRQQRQDVKSRIRGKLLQDIRQQKDNPEIERPLTLDLRPIYSMFEGFCDQDASGNKSLHEFLQRMLELMKKYIGNDNSVVTVLNPLTFLVNFSQNLVQDHTQSNIQSMIQFYEAALNLKYKYFYYIETERMGIIEAQSYIMWKSAFNMLLLILIHIKDAGKSRITTENDEKLGQYFQEWIDRTCLTLQVLSQQSIQFNNFYHQSIIQSLKQITEFCRLSVKAQNFISLNQIFTSRMIKLLHKTLSSHRMDQTAKILTTGIFLQIVNSHLTNAYHDLLQNGICDNMRYIIAFQTHLYISESSNERKNEEKIITNILQFMYEGCYLSSSDVFWQKGVISELIAILKEGVTKKVLKQDIITLILVAITTIQKRETLNLIEEAGIFQWVLNIIKSCIELRAYDTSLTQLINNGISAIRFFVELGETVKMQDNIYIIKLRYSSGIVILEQCPEGIEFLTEIKLHSEEL